MRALAHTVIPMLLLVATAAAQGSPIDKALQLDARSLVDRLDDLPLNAGQKVALGRLARLLEGLNIRFKTFETATPGDLALGFDYQLEKAILRPGPESSFSLDLAARGNVAFDRMLNPDDFLSTGLRLRWFGTAALGSGDERKAVADAARSAGATDLATFDPDLFTEFAGRAAHYTTADEVRADPGWPELTRRFFAGYLHRLPPELIWDVSLQATLESNQDFSSRQPTFGVSLGGRLVSWNPDSALSVFNLFDYPTAAFRWLAGTDEEFTPDGEAWPTVVVGLDYVEASEDELRSAVTTDDDFLRLRVEAGFRSRLLDLGDDAAFLSLGWRLHREFGAPGAIETADLDQYSHLQAAVSLLSGWAITYSAGRLPLDASDDSVFGLGFSVDF